MQYRNVALFASFTLLIAFNFCGAQQTGTSSVATLPVPMNWNAEEDHQNMMTQLGIKTLRPGADGNNRGASNYQNTDEAKANPFPNLPDPLTLNNGEKVATPEMWWQQRRPEIIEDFDREVYGRVPTNVPGVTWQVMSITRTNSGAVPVITKQIVGHVDNSSYPLINVDIRLTLTTPANAKGPVPVMIDFGFGGFGRPNRPGGTNGFTGLGGTNGLIATNGFARGGFGGGFGGSTWQQLVLSNGWGYAILIPTSYQADNGGELTRGIIGLCNQGQPRKPDDWGALRAWAWGASRALDYLETDKAVDAKQVGIEGLSRYGKATLVTMAYDQRFAIALVGSSGEGGAKLSRRNWGELVENLTSSGEYHWMAGNFIKYGGPLTPADLPVDSHELIALCAPRPTFISYGAAAGHPGVEGTWVDQHGSFMAAVAAGPVFRLLGQKDLGTPGNYLTDPMPPLNTALIDGTLAWRQHDGGHTDGPNWPVFLQWADRYLHGPPIAAATPGQAQPMVVAPDKTNGVYQVGDTVHWMIEWQGGTNIPVTPYVLKSGGYTKVGHGNLNFSNGVAFVDSTFDRPNTMLIEVGSGPDRVWGGAVAAPDRIKPAAPAPPDFDSFWRKKLKELKKIPANAQLEKEDSEKSGVDYWKITMDNINGTHIQGQLARPADGEKFPALIIPQWAGVYALQKSWVTDRARDGWLTLNLEAHDIPIDNPASYYKKIYAAGGALNNYWNIGNDDRDKSYYLRMYLSCVQAVKYLKSRPDWDGQTIVVMGQSQGGQQTLMLAGLCPGDITAALALVPAAADMLAPEVGRADGFPDWYSNTNGKDAQKVHAASRYYDPVNFASRIKCPVLIALGLHDEQLAPPSSILAVANEITAPKEVIILAKSGHQNEHGSQEPFFHRADYDWLPALKAGRPAPVNQSN